MILTAAQAGNAVSPEVATFVAAVAGLSMLLTPLLGQLGRRLAARRPQLPDANGMELTEPSGMENHVILAGYGRVGRAVARILQDEDVTIVALDRDPAKVHQARLDGLAAYVGDAARPEILELTGIARADQFIVTVDDPVRAEAMVRCARSLHADMLILARAHDGEHAAILEAAGAEHVVPEAVGQACRWRAWRWRTSDTIPRRCVTSWRLCATRNTAAPEPFPDQRAFATVRIRPRSQMSAGSCAYSRCQ